MDKQGKCCLCSAHYTNYGHNPDPLGDLQTERCCDDCNALYVIAARRQQRIDPDTAPEAVVRRYVKFLYLLKGG